MFNARDQRLPIGDPERLAALVRRAIDQRFGGSARRAAFQLCGIPAGAKDLSKEELNRVDAMRMQLGRLAALGAPEPDGDHAELSVRYVAMLPDLTGDEAIEELTEIFLPSHMLEARLRHEEWLSEGKPTSGYRVPMGEATEFFTDWANQILRERVLAWLREEFPGHMRRLERLLAEGGHSVERARVAYNRIVEPAFHHLRTDGVERGLHELSPEELRQYLKATIKREEILLKRPPDIERSRQASELLRGAFQDWLEAAHELVDPRALVPGLRKSSP